MDGFRYYFTPLAGVLFTFPSRYWFTIGRRLVFSLGRWSSRIPTGFHVSRGTWVCRPESLSHFVYRTFTVCGRPFQDRSTITEVYHSPTGLQPRPATSRYPPHTTLA